MALFNDAEDQGVGWNTPVTYRGSCTWLYISQWEQLVPRPQSHHQTRRRWPARRRACFHPSALHQGCRVRVREKKKRRCFLCSERTTITVPETAPSVRVSVTFARHERHCCWTCVFCSAVCPLDPQPQQARSASEREKKSTVFIVRRRLVSHAPSCPNWLCRPDLASCLGNNPLKKENVVGKI